MKECPNFLKRVRTFFATLPSQTPMPVGLDKVVYDIQKNGKGPGGFLSTSYWAKYSIERAQRLAKLRDLGINGSRRPLDATGMDFFRYEISESLKTAQEAIEAGAGVSTATYDTFCKLREKYPKKQN